MRARGVDDRFEHESLLSKERLDAPEVRLLEADLTDADAMQQ